MPNKHFYFVLGATHGALVAAWIYRRRHAWYPRYAWVRGLYRRDRDWTLYLPFVMVAFGLLALVPDILYGLGILPKPVIRSAAFNLFYGYAWFERSEGLDPLLDWLISTPSGRSSCMRWPSASSAFTRVKPRAGLGTVRAGPP